MRSHDAHRIRIRRVCSRSMGSVCCKTRSLSPRHAPDAHPGRSDIFNKLQFGSGYIAEIPIDQPGIVMAVARHAYREEAKLVKPG